MVFLNPEARSAGLFTGRARSAGDPGRDPPPDPDGDLVRRAGHGDPAAIQALVARKLPRVLALAGRLLGDVGEAEDVAQEAMLKVWRHAAGWTPGRAKFDTWLHRVALNLCYDRLRRRREVVVAEPPERADPTPSAEARLETRDLGHRVDEALKALPPRQREALVLCHYQELSNIEAAALMEISVEALESLLSRARRTLRTTLADLSPVRPSTTISQTRGGPLPGQDDRP